MKTSKKIGFWFSFSTWIEAIYYICRYGLNGADKKLDEEKKQADEELNQIKRKLDWYKRLNEP